MQLDFADNSEDEDSVILMILKMMMIKWGYVADHNRSVDIADDADSACDAF